MSREESRNQKFQNDLKHKAQVKREEVVGTESAQAAERKLLEIGELLNPIPGIEYVGSAAVHIYKTEIGGQMFFATQVGTLRDCPETLAQAAFKDLAGTAMEHFGRKRPKHRSGF